jgi:hypothetical protein
MELLTGYIKAKIVEKIIVCAWNSSGSIITQCVYNQVGNVASNLSILITDPLWNKEIQKDKFGKVLIKIYSSHDDIDEIIFVDKHINEL